MKVPAANPNMEDESETQRIISPFAQTTSTVQSPKKGGSSFSALWIVSCLLIVVIVSIIGYFIYKYLDDPYRTLKPFPMDTYFSDYHSLSGEKFKADLKVANLVQYKPETGRLMAFNMENDSRSLVVLLPPKFDSLYFSKGQNYLVSLVVGEGGLVYAESCEKE
jgi:hypothetical protein